jgi:hypothetical protein
VHFDSTKQHSIANSGDEVAEVLVVTTMGGLLDDHPTA